MNLGETVSIAVSSVRHNPLRSALTVTGIVIGVLTVISIVSIVQGINNYVASEVGSLGSNIFSISKMGIPRNDRELYEYRRRKDLTVENTVAISRFCPSVGRVCYSSQTFGRVAYEGEVTSEVNIRGVSAGFISARSWAISLGRDFLEIEFARGNNVCILGSETARVLFGPEKDRCTEYIEDRYINIGKKEFRVAGILEPRGSFFGQTLDGQILIPHRTFEKNFGTRKPILILVQAKNAAALPMAVEEARNILRVRRNLPPGAEDNFVIYTQELLMRLYNNFTVTAFTVIILVSFISLLVGGIGIMNIMLVSITERTREIGIRKAIGARNRDIVYQFLAESLTLSLIGGVIGVILGLFLVIFASRIIGMKAVIPYWTVCLGLFFSITVGLLFGIFPARRAARLDPIQTIHYE